MVDDMKDNIRKYKIQPDYSLDIKESIVQADSFLAIKPLSLTDVISPMGEEHKNEYYSNGDYWWPNPDSIDGLPYVRIDGNSNPNNFSYHRMALRRTRTMVSHLARAYKHSKKELYAKKAMDLLDVFFINKSTAMQPHLLYAQAVPGRYTGRGVGIIDTVHLCDIVYAVQALKGSKHMSIHKEQALIEWFSRYLQWLVQHEYGKDEAKEANNHSICYFVQLACFARFTHNKEVLQYCRNMFFEKVIIQMNSDGSFPLELARTKPYAYSLMVLDNFTIITHLLSDETFNLWEYEHAGRSIEKAVHFMLPYILDKNKWPYAKDIQYFDAYPNRMAFMIFAGYTLGIQKLLDVYTALPFESNIEEARRNITARQPFLWL